MAWWWWLLLPFLWAAAGDDVMVVGQPHSLGPQDRITGNLVVIGAPTRVNGQVLGSVVVIAGKLTLGGQALVGREVVVLGGSLVREPGARILGETTLVGLPPLPHFGLPALPPVWLQSLLLLGLILLIGNALGQAVTVAVETLAQNRVKSLAWGVITWLVVPASGILLLFTLIGIVLLPLHAIASMLLALLAMAVSAQWFGQRILKIRRIWLQRLMGAVLLVATGLIPWLGPAVLIAATLLGSGALMIGFGRRQRALWEQVR